jgi:NCAIR mutase (PurE)-related protein
VDHGQLNEGQPGQGQPGQGQPGQGQPGQGQPEEDRPDQALTPALALGFATVDLDRPRRQGLPEVIYAPGKRPGEIAAIAAALLARTSGPVLVTRVEPGAAAQVSADVVAAGEHGPGGYNAPARLLCWRPASPGGCRVAMVTAGTADGPVADEAAAVARATGLEVTEFRDVGVAGLHRLLTVAGDIGAADVVVVIAGMEGALASAVAGLVGVPVVAVPTSTGYGAALEGITALLAMMTSCAAGVCVVNIDSGFGAAMAAYRLAFSLRRPRPAPPHPAPPHPAPPHPAPPHPAPPHPAPRGRVSGP